MKKLRTELLLSFAVVITVSLLPLMAFTDLLTKQFLENRMSAVSRDLLNQLDSNLQMLLNDTQDLSLFMISNHDVRAALKAPKADEAGDPGLSRLYETFTSLTGSKPYILSVNFYGLNGLRFETAGPSSPAAAPEASPELPRDGEYVMTGPYQRDFSTVGRQYILSFSRRINDINALDRNLGSLRIDVGEEAISQLYRDLFVGDGGSIFVADTQGRVLSHPDKERLGRRLLDEPLYAGAFHGGEGYYLYPESGRQMMVAYRTNSDLGFVAVNVMDLNEIFQDALLKKDIFLLIAAVSCLVAILLAFLTARSISGAVQQLIVKMQAVAEGDLDTRIQIRRKDEIGELGRRFNSMVEQLKNLVEEVYVSHIKRKEAQLQALEAQINPHFLYNTLDAIYWTARLEKAPRTEKAVLSLSRFYRYGLNNGREITTVENELEQLCSYLDIQKLSFNEAPRITIDVDPALRPCKLPKLLLQPLVENALFHGIGSMGGEGRVLLTGRDCGELMVFEVADNGDGIPPEKLAELLDGAGEKKGYGLRNVHQRIKLYFGEEYGLEIDSKVGQWTCVSARLPKKP